MNGICHISFDDYLWDANGNINKIVGPRRPSTRAHYFNEENRLAAKSDWPGLLPLNTTISSSLASYLYSADGERVWKFAGTATMTYSNGQLVNSDLEMDKTFYPTPHTTFDKQKFYKHYFIGGERICTEVTMWNALPNLQGNHVGVIHGNASQFVAGLGEQVRHALDSVGYNGDIAYNQGNYSIPGSSQIYYYHYNHQGSVALVTNMVGTIRQHLQYLPYGGTFVDHRTGSYSSTYTFSAKEKDSESGYTYFGARYYSDGIMQWLSVDPMSDKYPSVSPYMYCAGNPIMICDPNGDTVKFVNSEAVRCVSNLINKNSPDYNKAFARKYHRLERSKTVYNMEHVSGDALEGHAGNVDNGESGSVDIKFTTNFGTRTTSLGGFSPEYAALFEEVYHAVDYDKGRFSLGVGSTITRKDEARAWKFAAKAPGTTLRFTNGYYKDYTIAHTFKTLSTSTIANYFLTGKEPWVDSDGSGNMHYMINSNTLDDNGKPLGLYRGLIR